MRGVWEDLASGDGVSAELGDGGEGLVLEGSSRGGPLCQGKLGGAAGLRWAGLGHPKKSPIVAAWCRLRRPSQLGRG